MDKDAKEALQQAVDAMPPEIAQAAAADLGADESTALPPLPTQRELDLQAVQYTLHKTREELAIATVNWHITKTVPVEEVLANGQKRKVHPNTLVRRIAELQDQAAMLEALLEPMAELVRPAKGSVLEVAPERELILPETQLPPDVG